MTHVKDLTSKRTMLVVAAEEWLPWAKIVIGENNTLSVEGIMGDILRSLAQVLKFDYKLVRPPDGEWGIPLPNGSWNGLINIILQGEAEFALGPFSVSPVRASVVDFSVPIHNGEIGIVTARPTIKNDVEGFLKPFTFHVWLLTLFSLMAVGLSLAFIERIEGKVFHFLPKKDIMSKSVLWSIKALTQEGCEWLPKKDGGRLIVTTWLLASLVFMTSYSGILTAMLTAPRVTIPVDSLEDLVAQRDIVWKIKPSGSFSSNYLKESKEEVHQKTYNRAIGYVHSCWGNREDIVQGKYAVLCQGMAIKKVMSWDFSTTGRCHIYMARNMFYSNDLQSLAFKAKSPHLEKANRVLDSLKETGIMKHWLSQQVKNISHCMRPPSADISVDDIAPLNIEALGGSFILLAGGLVLAFLFFLGELGFYYNQVW